MVMETFRDEPHKAPNLVREEALQQAFDEAKATYLARVTAQAEQTLRAEVARRADEALAGIRAAEALADERGAREFEAIQAYAKLAPHRVRKSGISPPSVNDRLLTFNRIGEAYAAAAEAIAAAADAQARVNAGNKAYAALNHDLMRAIALRGDAARKKLETPDGLAAACTSDLGLFAAHARLQVALAERTAYEESVRRGEVSAEGARDHEMAQRKLVFVTAPMTGVVIESVVRYGSLTYYLLRGLDNRRALLSADVALEPLRDLVFDIGSKMNVITATVHQSGEKRVPMRVLDHIKACTPAAEVDAAYDRHRAQLRADTVEGALRPRDAAEREIVNALACLARQLTGSKPSVVRAMR